LSEVVLDASVIAKWFHTGGEENIAAATKLRGAFEAGELSVLTPSLLHLEIMNAAGRRWRLDETALLAVAEALGALQFAITEPDLGLLATWVARGLTAYDAAYVAVAEAESLSLITDDGGILLVAPAIAIALGSDDVLGELRERTP
jgi:predicted nucleic acid-binding protein